MQNGERLGCCCTLGSEIIKKRKKGEIWPFPASGLDGVPVKCQNIASMFWHLTFSTFSIPGHKDKNAKKWSHFYLTVDMTKVCLGGKK